MNNGTKYSKTPHLRFLCGAGRFEHQTQENLIWRKFNTEIMNETECQMKEN
jgi:hypothetical protein